MFRTIPTTLMAAALAASLATGAVAQTQPQMPVNFAAEHLAAARSAITASKAAEGFDNILPAVAQQAKALFIRTNPTLTTQIEEVVTTVALDMAKSRPDLDREIQRVWASRFSKSELEEIAKFYNSPVGVKLANESADMVALSARAAMAWQQKLSTDMVTRVREEMKKRGFNL